MILYSTSSTAQITVTLTLRTISAPAWQFDSGGTDGFTVIGTADITNATKGTYTGTKDITINYY